MRRNQRIFIFLFIFFIVIAAGAIFILDDRGSVFNRNAKSMGAQVAVLNETIAGTADDASDVNAAVASLEAKEEEPKAPSEPEVKVEVAEEPVEEVEEEPAEEEPELRYFTFTVTTEAHNLRLREEASGDSRILTKFRKGTTGYILKPGKEWCKVYTQTDDEGYFYTGYLILEEVTKEDFPEDLQERVELPEEGFEFESGSVAETAVNEAADTAGAAADTTEAAADTVGTAADTADTQAEGTEDTP